MAERPEVERPARPGEPLHVLMTADCLGGVWDHALTLAGQLGRAGARTTLAVLGGPLAPDQRQAAAAVSGLHLEESDWRLEWMPDAGADVARSGDWLLGLEDRLRPNVVHVNGYAHAALPFRAPVLCAGHSCVRSWFAAVRGEPPLSDFDRYAEGVRAGLAAAGMVVTPSRTMAAALAFHYGVPVEPVVIPNGVAVEDFAPAAKDDLILSVGRIWDEGKNIAALEAVAPLLGSPVAVAGESRHPDGSERAPRAVALLGRLPSAELRDWYARAAVFCLPARYEPFGLAVLEAALSGCALVLGNSPGLRENWDGAAVFVDPDDTAGLARALNRLVCDHARRCDLAERARIRGRRFRADTMARSYLGAYAALTGAPRRRYGVG
ncbi:glycosyltransferase family 4 protein [Rhodospirillum centenum]|uniref:Glycosyl transferase, group 1 family protein n=1 Tax=Rhodospirillum centenum (strain ATCC 51521 / SW) TaxID=414684 RepID=B6IR80_RHOCS|nr:glycosyltransferase family 4 protein [Rhodospirillum centenum]ACI97966.1 glycosyl transferase, group 1 family protein [Rhodospirillum centenum SW]